jgi:hypothetical protein
MVFSYDTSTPGGQQLLCQNKITMSLKETPVNARPSPNSPRIPGSICRRGLQNIVTMTLFEVGQNDNCEAKMNLKIAITYEFIFICARHEASRTMQNYEHDNMSYLI